MHMADALIVPAVAGTMYAASSIAAGTGIYKIKKEDELKKVPVMGVMGAFVFATQMINFTIPGTGSSGHLCGGMLLAAVLGPYAGFLSMIGVLLIQCLLFADGGLMALGCNVWNMAFYGCFLGSLLIWKPIMNKGASRAKIIIASIIGCVGTLQLGAFSVCIETLISGVTELPFSTFVSLMQPIHLAIGLVEGLITAAVLIFVYEARPELLWGVGASEDEIKEKKGLSLKATIIVLAVATVLVGGVLSYLASANPDGLEWSIEKITGDTEIAGMENAIAAGAESIQNVTAILPDYAFKSSENPLGGGFSGIFGSAVVFAVCVGVCLLLKKVFKKN